jgi:pseudaminic acid synthase
VKKGELLTTDNIRSIRPGHGMHPKYLKEILGKNFNADFDLGTPLSTEMFT